MSFNKEFEFACLRESNRRVIAEKWAKVNLSQQAKDFNKGRKDRVAGLPCRSANGDYLDGWYSIPNPT